MNQGLLLELILLGIVILVLIVYLIKNKDKIHIQPIVGFGKFNIISMALVRTGWGLDAMDRWAKSHREWVRLFGFISIGIGFIGMILTFLLLFVIAKGIFTAPSVAQVSIVLPFTNVPGIGYLAFSHWIIALIILASVHEFAHGVVARTYNIPVKHSGFAVLKVLFVPILPAAFVEPDEKQFPKRSDVEQYSVLTAGPSSNILLSVIFGLMMLFIFNPMTTQMTEPVGFSFTSVMENMPAANASIIAGKTYNSINGQLTNNSAEFYKQIWFNAKPGDKITIDYYNYTTGQQTESHEITTIVSPADGTTAFIGVTGITDVRDFKPEHKNKQNVFNWFKKLIQRCFLLNIAIGLMNLMPLFVTDGGQIIRVFAKQLYGKDKAKAERAYKLVNGICLLVILLGLFTPLFF